MHFHRWLLAAALVASAGARAKTRDLCVEALVNPVPRTLRLAGWNIPQESSGEVEMPFEAIAGRTTTSDGSVATVLYGHGLPAWFADRYGKRPRAITWRDVADIDRLRLLIDVNAAVEREPWYARNYALAENNDHFLPIAMPGLRVLRSDDPMHASHWLNPHLEYARERTNPTWVEAHFRGPFAPSVTAQSLRTLFPHAPSLHVHAPVPLAFETLRNEGVRGAALRTDFYLRANAFAELATVVYRRRSLRVGETIGTSPGTGPMCADAIPDVARQFFGERLAHDAWGAWLVKNAFVGLRDDYVYDRRGVRATTRRSDPDAFRWFGLEFRFLRSGKRGLFGEFDDRSWPVVLRFLDAARLQLESGAFGTMPRRLDRWAQNAWPRPVDAASLGDAMRNSWWRSPEQFNWLVDTVSHAKARRLREAFETQEEVAALVFDWNRFPLVAGDRNLAMKIRAEQVRAVAKMDATEDLNGLVAEMVWRSGLFEVLGKSFGVRVVRPSWLPRAPASEPSP